MRFRLRGFALLELVVVLAIIAIVAALAIPAFQSSLKRAEKMQMPEFPWPPPKASAFEVIPRELLVSHNHATKLRDVASALEAAFRRCGYIEKSYYAVPDGFALASRIEQINEDGSASRDRWSLDVPNMRQFSLSAYLAALFNAPRAGHFRIIVFIVTPHPFTQSNVPITAAEAREWISAGANTLPDEVGEQDYSRRHDCTALIYEFKGSGAKRAVFVEPSELSAETHLVKAGLVAALSKQSLSFP
jgi:prepilin-type N-terminal cleavage/methylation domain-containing protein